MDAQKLQDLNQRKGGNRFVKALNGIIFTTNLTIAIGAFAVILIKALSGSQIPKLLTSYSLAPINIFVAIFMLIMTNAYDRYYDLYTRSTFTTAIGDAIDVTVKAILLIATFFLVAFPNALVPIVTLLYLIDHLRIRELQRSVNKANPFYKYLTGSMIPNNIRHNRALLAISAFWLLTERGLLPHLGALVTAQSFTIPDSMLSEVQSLMKPVLTIFFIIYWGMRMVIKRTHSRNPLLQPSKLADIDKEIADFIEKGGDVASS